jgi:SAM-dependent methyltransferase
MADGPSEASGIIDLYQRKARDWAESRARGNLFEKPWLDRFRALLQASPVLDLGCGSGEPMARYLIGLRHPVVGVDSSEAMIDFCRSRFPEQEWIVADMRKLALRRQFSGILAWDSFFHLCPDDQRRMFAVFREHAAPGAALMFTSGPAHGEAIGSLAVSRCIMQASTRTNIARCSIETGFAWWRMSWRTPTAAATLSGSRSTSSSRFAPAFFPTMIRSRKDRYRIEVPGTEAGARAPARGGDRDEFSTSIIGDLPAGRIPNSS